MKDLKGLVNRFIRENLVIRKKSKKSERNIQRLPFFVTSCRRVRHKLPRRGKRRPAGGRTIKEAAAAGPPLPALLYGAASCAGFSSMVPLSWAESEWIGYKQKEKFYQYDTKTLTERPWSFLSLYSIINTALRAPVTSQLSCGGYLQRLSNIREIDLFLLESVCKTLRHWSGVEIYE